MGTGNRMRGNGPKAMGGSGWILGIFSSWKGLSSPAQAAQDRGGVTSHGGFNGFGNVVLGGTETFGLDEFRVISQPKQLWDSATFSSLGSLRWELPSVPDFFGAASHENFLLIHLNTFSQPNYYSKFH